MNVQDVDQSDDYGDEFGDNFGKDDKSEGDLLEDESTTFKDIIKQKINTNKFK